MTGYATAKILQMFSLLWKEVKSGYSDIYWDLPFQRRRDHEIHDANMKAFVNSL